MTRRQHGSSGAGFAAWRLTEREAVEAQIPRLEGASYRITSPRDVRYNCFAWAAGDVTRVWSPTLLGSGVYWPPGIPALPSMSGAIEAYEQCGFARCPNGVLEEGYEKIAIFAAPGDDEPRHAARQQSDGTWTSKLGPNVDVEHDDVAAVGGSFYGEPSVFLRRPRPPASADAPATGIVLPGEQ
jgi:hypothetical protein